MLCVLSWLANVSQIHIQESPVLRADTGANIKLAANGQF